MTDDWDEAIHDATDLYRDANIEWGHDAQTAKAAEEFSEFAAVCARDLNGQAEFEEFLRELIGARLMMEQMVQQISDDALRQKADKQLKELEERIHGENE